jgi:hypothetical protein
MLCVYTEEEGTISSWQGHRITYIAKTSRGRIPNQEHRMADAITGDDGAEIVKQEHIVT